MHGFMAISAVSGVANIYSAKSIKTEPVAHNEAHQTRMHEHAKQRVAAAEKPAEIEQAPDGDNHIHVVA